jgi:RNA polymerase sigma-70 factor (ECF subfamily)
LERVLQTYYTPREFTSEELVDNYGEQIFRFCCRLTYSKEDAEDLFQETFMRVFEQLSKVNASEEPKNFIFSAALYLWKSKKRTYARRNHIAPMQSLDDEMVSDIDVEYSIMAQEDARLVREIVHVLPEKFKIPIILHYSAGMDLPDIAATLKVPIGTVKSRLYRARKAVEKGLVKIGYGK